MRARSMRGAGAPALNGLHVAILALLGVLPFVPAFLWDAGPRSLFRYSFEYGFALLAVALAARTTSQRLVRRFVIGLYALLLLFLIYEHAFKSFFHREPALVEDARLAINLVHFLSEMTSWRWLARLLGYLVGAVALLVLMEDALATFQKRLQAAKPLHLAFAAALWSTAGGISSLFGGPIRVASAKVVDNVRASMVARGRLAGLGDGVRDQRYEDLMKVRLSKRPNFDFLVVEAYGEVLATWDMADAYRALMARVQARLEASGYRMRTAYSAAPVHGGSSWLSLATMQAGILIDQPESFAAFGSVSREVPTLVGFFRAQGYHTASLEPGTKPRVGVGDGDLYAHELRIGALQLDYAGPSWGFGEIPDAYSLERFRTRTMGALGEPRYVFYMAVSTHYPWTAETVPSFGGEGTDWPPLPGVDAIASEFRRFYLKSVEYEWRALTRFLEADRSPDIVVIILGDHQPRLESNAPGEVTFDTPVHVISRDGAFVEQFAKHGFQPGLYAEPGRAPPLLHQGLFSLFVTELAAAYATPQTQGFATYFPQGIGLRGLNR